MRKISCLICAYNEAGRIGEVLKVLASHPLIDEVLVVNDGSTDNTAEEVKKYKTVKLVTLNVNKGKTQALIKGLSLLRNEWVLLLDADLIGLEKADIDALLKPIFSNEADISMSLRQNSLGIYKFIGLDFVSGERIFNKNLLKDSDASLAKLPRFGFEVFMNEKILSAQLAIAVVKWENVSHVRKSKKMGTWQGLWSDIKMALDMIKTIGAYKILKQNAELLKLKRDVE